VVPDIQPPELASLLDVAERPRHGGWSLRAALTRYAQGQPRRVGELLQLVRRIEAALAKEAKALGPDVWARLSTDADDQLVGVLRCAQSIDAVGDTLAAWAADPWDVEKPHAEVDDAIASVTAALDSLGIPEEGPPDRPPSARRRRA
jgi:hypothetical protein